MANQMPKELLERFKKKEETGKNGETDDKNKKMARIEALRKAKKAKVKRSADKENSGK
jgi:hypothetical protein